MSYSDCFFEFDLTYYYSSVIYHNWLCERHYKKCFNYDDSNFERDQFYLEF